MAAGFVKRSVKGTFEMGETAAIAHERSLFISALATADKKEGLEAFMKKRKAQFKDGGEEKCDADDVMSLW